MPESVAEENDHPAPQLPDWKKGILLWEAHVYHQGDDGKVTVYTLSAGGVVDCGFPPPPTPHLSMDCWGNTWLLMDETRWMFKLAAFAQNGAEQDHSFLIDQSKLCMPEHKPLTPFCSATRKRLCARPPGDGKMFCNHSVLWAAPWRNLISFAVVVNVTSACCRYPFHTMFNSGCTLLAHRERWSMKRRK